MVTRPARRFLLSGLVAIALLLGVAPAAVAAQGGVLGTGLLAPPPPPTTPSAPSAPSAAPTTGAAPATPANPDTSGSGRRIVYAVSAQRIWLVEGDGSVFGTWPVSGRAGIPKPGTYRVFSRSEKSSAGSLRLDYMVRFVPGRKAIGFHAIPVTRSGRPIQTESELGQYRSRGCVRQRPADALTLWNWAPIGTQVVVVA